MASYSDQPMRRYEHLMIKKRFRIWQPHEATFRGCHNSVKGKVLIILYHRLLVRHDTSGLNLSDLVAQSGCKYSSLSSRLGYWVKWKYIQRRISLDKRERPVFTYSISERGVRFIDIRMPRDVRDRLVNEIKQTRPVRAK
jgi:hypothetical protein